MGISDVEIGNQWESPTQGVAHEEVVNRTLVTLYLVGDGGDVEGCLDDGFEDMGFRREVNLVVGSLSCGGVGEGFETDVVEILVEKFDRTNHVAYMPLCASSQRHLGDELEVVDILVFT